MIQFLKKVSFVYMADTPWCGDQADKLYRQSGQFTSTIKDSEYVGGIEVFPIGICWDGTNTPWIGYVDDRMYLQSGHFTSTLKKSQSISGIDQNPKGITYDGTDTPWAGSEAGKLYLQSGQFTSTVITSFIVTGIDATIGGVSYDGADTPWCGAQADKLYRQSGQFTGTIKDSEYIGGIDINPSGISWDGTNTPWCGHGDDKLYCQSGHFTSTLKKSQDVSSVDTAVHDISTDDYDGRTSGGPQVYERSVSNTASFGQQVVGSLKEDTPWVSNPTDKLYLTSGQFTSTIKDSYNVSGIDNWPTDISWDGFNTPWCGDSANKLYLQSEQFTSTLKTSKNIGGIDIFPYGISWDGENTPWIGSQANKLYHQSGQFTSTIKDSEYIGSIDIGPGGISYDGTDTPWSGDQADKLYRTSGQFTSTIKDSEYIGGIDNQPYGISWDGVNTPWGGGEANKLYLQSGHFTSTLKKSQAVGTTVSGIDTNDVRKRIGSYERSLTTTITLGQSVSQAGSTFNRSLTTTITLGQSVSPSGSIFDRSLTTTITLGQVASAPTIYPRSASMTITFDYDVTPTLIKEVKYVYIPQLEQTLLFNHQLIIDKVFGLPAIEICRLNLPRWILASASKYFSIVAANNNLHYFVEGTTRETEEHQKYIEFRLDGPSFTQLSKGFYRLDVEINILWSFNQNDEDFHEPERIKGILIDAMQNLCIYKYGDGPYDDDNYIGTLQLKQDRRTAVRVSNFGQVKPDIRLMQGTIEGSYSMLHSC